MSSTSRKPADNTPPEAPPEVVEESPVDAASWSAGNGPLQVPLAGLLVDDPSLQTAELTPSEWQARLNEYLESPRPPVEADKS
jgi:hypothetical protein